MILNKSSAEIMYMRGGKGGGEVIPHLGLINGKVKKKGICVEGRGLFCLPF